MNGCWELVASLEEVELENEKKANKVTTKLLDEFAGCACGATWVFWSGSVRRIVLIFLTCGNNVVHHEDVLALLHSICLDLKVIRTIFLLEARLFRRTRQLSPLSDWGKSGSKFQSKTGTEKKTSCVEADHNIWLDAVEGGKHLKLEGADQGFVEGGVGEER